MHDLALFAVAFFIVFTVYVICKAIELVSQCWHHWGTWDVSETEHAYVQQRKCTKCGYVATEQFRKMKEKSDDDC
jgi:dissimilatory sulfite reductase (desulfoviridin) alpha/beta subunit